jgi:phosphate-selective porin OprO and OprP
MKDVIKAALCAAALMTAHTTASASSKEQLLLDVLLQNGSITRAQHAELSAVFAQEGEVTQDQIQAAQEAGRTAAAAEIAKAKSDPKGGKLVVKDSIGFESNDGQFSVSAGGRVQTDVAIYDDDNRSLGNGTTIRRGRLNVQGTMFKDWQFKGEYEFARNNLNVVDAYLRYTGFKPFDLKSNLTAGNFKPPFSLEALNGDTDTTFMERSIAVDAFNSNTRRVGLGADLAATRWTFATGVFGETVTGDTFTGDPESDTGWSTVGRMTGLPWMDGANLVHLGAAMEYRDTNDAETFRFGPRGPESQVTAQRLVDSGNLFNIDDFMRYGFEFAAVYGPFSLQSEYIGMDIQRQSGSGQSDLFFDGWYAQGGWLLTGESRPYDSQRGIFLPIKPDGKYGAFELAFRFSTVDLNDEIVVGGDADLITAAINWYITSRIRLAFNYIDVLSLDGAGPADNDEPSVLTARAQVVF